MSAGKRAARRVDLIVAATTSEINRAQRLVGQEVTPAFDPADAEAARVMRNSRLQFVRDFTSGQRQTVRRALASSLERREDNRRAWLPL